MKVVRSLINKSLGDGDSDDRVMIVKATYLVRFSRIVMAQSL